MPEAEARHYLREVLMAAIHRADEGCADWRIADALLDAGEITWNYQIRPEPQVATFQLIFTATDAEPASGGVVEPSGPLTAEVATPEPCDRTDLPELADMMCGACGIRAGDHPAWRKRHRQHDPGALIEEPDLYPKVHDPDDERRADDAHMAAGEAWMEHDAEQGEGDDRG